VTQDVDLWFRDLEDPRLRKALARVEAIYVPPRAHHGPVFAGSGTELFDVVLKPQGLRSFVVEARRALRIPLGRVEVPVLPLDRVIVSKRAADRPKDRAILPVLEDTLRVIQSRRPSRRRTRGSPAKRRRRSAPRSRG
jgi:hypothetical protein